MIDFKRIARRSTSFLGFKKWYNVACFILFAGAMLGFSISRLEFLSFNGVFCKPHTLHGAVPGECYWYRQHFYKVAILIHVGCVLPAALLAMLQFIPSIRHHLSIFHRINGYVVILLFLTSNGGALAVSRHATGGTVATQTIIGILFIMTTFGILNAYYNVKRLQLDQHRAWMLRTFAWSGAIISSRIILYAMISAISSLPSSYDYYDVRSCNELTSIAGTRPVYQLYPECVPGSSNSSTPGHVAVRARQNPNNPYESVAVVGVSFPAAMILSLFIHAVGIEIYLTLTPREAQRLRQNSYQRQLERGFKHPGSAGLVPERFGDADPWIPANQGEKIKQERNPMTPSSLHEDENSTGGEDKRVVTTTVIDSAET